MQQNRTVNAEKSDDGTIGKPKWGCAIYWFKIKSSNLMRPSSECNGGDDGGLRCQFALLELSKPSNFGGNINNWNQKKVRTQNRPALVVPFHQLGLEAKAVSPLVLNQHTTVEIMVSSDLSSSF